LPDLSLFHNLTIWYLSLFTPAFVTVIYEINRSYRPYRARSEQNERNEEYWAKCRWLREDRGDRDGGGREANPSQGCVRNAKRQYYADIDGLQALGWEDGVGLYTDGPVLANWASEHGELHHRVPGS
jgi:hypothetical protein